MSSFWSLSTERYIGMAVGPIPESKIYEYASRHDISRVRIPMFVEVIRRMDAAYMGWKSEQEDKKTGTPPIIGRTEVAKRK